MTRFARAHGSKASNERQPEEPTSWMEMKQQLADQSTTKTKMLDNLESTAKHFILQKNKNKCSDTKWADFDDVPCPKKKKRSKSGLADEMPEEEMGSGVQEKTSKKIQKGKKNATVIEKKANAAETCRLTEAFPKKKVDCLGKEKLFKKIQDKTNFNKEKLKLNGAKKLKKNKLLSNVNQDVVTFVPSSKLTEQILKKDEQKKLKKSNNSGCSDDTDALTSFEKLGKKLEKSVKSDGAGFKLTKKQEKRKRHLQKKRQNDGFTPPAQIAPKKIAKNNTALITNLTNDQKMLKKEKKKKKLKFEKNLGSSLVSVSATSSDISESVNKSKMTIESTNQTQYKVLPVKMPKRNTVVKENLPIENCGKIKKKKPKLEKNLGLPLMSDVATSNDSCEPVGKSQNIDEPTDQTQCNVVSVKGVMSKRQKRNLKQKQKTSNTISNQTDGEPTSVRLPKRRKVAEESVTMYINGEEIEVTKFDGFPVRKQDADRLKELRQQMIDNGIPPDEMRLSMKLERRKAEKALARERRKVCFHCRKTGHNLSDCPELGQGANQDAAGTGICFKCGSTEHTHFECRVNRGDEFRFAQCFICREQGHISRQCPDNPRGLYPKGGACKMCGDVTHLKKDCPDLREGKEQQAITLEKSYGDKPEALEEDLKVKQAPAEKSSSNKIIKF